MKTARYFLNKRASAKEIFDKELNSRWHPKLGTTLVALGSIDGYDTREQAIEAAKEFRAHCRKMVREERKKKQP